VGEITLGSGEQFFALAGAFGGEIGVAADHQPLAGELGGGDAGHVALVEQRKLQGAALQERLDRRCAQGYHAAVADHHHMLEVKALFEFVDLAGQGHRIDGVPVEHFDSDWAAVGCAEQAVSDLQRAPAVIASVAALGERAATPLHIARGDVVEHERAVAEMAFGQRGLDRGLALQQPIERSVELVFIDLADAEHLAEARSGGCRRERAGGEYEIAAAVAVGAEHPVEADSAGRAEGGGDMAVRQRTGDGERVAVGGDDGSAPEHAAQPFNVSGRPVGEVAERAFTNFAAFAMALAQQDGGRRVPVGHRFDIHARVCAHRRWKYKSKISDYMAKV
jgi:hypothetical protein